MARKYFPFYFSFYETAQTMSPKNRAAFYQAIVEYGVTGKEPTLPKAISGYWPLIKPLLDTSRKRYEAGATGGRPSKSPDFGFFDIKTNGLDKEKEKVEEKEKSGPTAPPAAVAPHKGALGGMTALEASTTDRDSDTKEALERFINSIRPSWAAADAAPPDVEKEEE